jgi:hypothetical protein
MHYLLCYTKSVDKIMIHLKYSIEAVPAIRGTCTDSLKPNVCYSRNLDSKNEIFGCV